MAGISAGTSHGESGFLGPAFLWGGSFILMANVMNWFGLPWPNQNAFLVRAAVLAIVWAISFAVCKLALVAISVATRWFVQLATNALRKAGETLAGVLAMAAQNAQRLIFRGRFQRNAGSQQDNGQQQSAATVPDPFAAACRLIGLPEDGTFTAAELKARFHVLMKAVHPDLVGPNLFATQLNEACGLIKSRKGWK